MLQTCVHHSNISKGFPRTIPTQPVTMPHNLATTTPFTPVRAPLTAGPQAPWPLPLSFLCADRGASRPLPFQHQHLASFALLQAAPAPASVCFNATEVRHSRGADCQHDRGAGCQCGRGATALRSTTTRRCSKATEQNAAPRRLSSTMKKRKGLLIRKHQPSR